MILLGASREVTQDFSSHKTAEDYSGEHLSIIKITGRARVVRVVNKYVPHEDSINYNEFLRNQGQWRDGDFYNCISITGKTVRIPKDELGGNCVELEGYVNGEYLRYGIFHMASANVSVGDIVDSSTIIGYQGNTGLVNSSKAWTNPTYGTHVHFQVQNQSGTYLNPREYALGNYVIDYKSQSNEEDNSKDQFRVLVTSIRIRKTPSTASEVLGYVYYQDLFTIIDKTSDEQYDWYKITTSLGVTGWVADLKNGGWLEIIPKAEEEPNPDPEPDVPCEDYKLIFTCSEEGLYYLKLKQGEQLYLKNGK